jgi:hypothetical protein
MGSLYQSTPFGTIVLLTCLATGEGAALRRHGESHSEEGGVGFPAGLSQKPDVPTVELLFAGVVELLDPVEFELPNPTLADHMDISSIGAPFRFKMNFPSWASGHSLARTASVVHT